MPSELPDDLAALSPEAVPAPVLEPRSTWDDQRPELPVEPVDTNREREIRSPFVTRMHAPISRRTLALGAAGALLAGTVFAGGWAIGAHDPLLAPVQISPALEQVGLTGPERVFQTVKDSVVTIQTPGGSTGTGFFYRPDRIVTNNHVVSSTADTLRQLAQGQHPKVTVTLTDGRTRTGSVLAVDTRLDIAVVSVPSGLGVRPLAFGDSHDVNPGQQAVVVGAPFGMTTSVSTGIISGRDRSTQFAADPVQNELLQTDAAVNPGNSGGPLLDASAAVVGVVTLRPDQSNGRTAQGIAFALPSNAVVAAIHQLELYGKVSHPQIGIHLANPDPDKAGERGAVIEKVETGSPADKAGLRAGDQILEVNDTAVQTASDVIDTLIGKRAGDRIDLVGVRGKDGLSVTVTLKERPTDS